MLLTTPNRQERWPAWRFRGLLAYDLGTDLEGLDAQPGTPGRWWTHYFNSSTNMIDYAKKRGVPAGAGETALDFSGDRLIATTILGGAPVIRTTCTVKVGAGQRASGQLRSSRASADNWSAAAIPS